MKRGVPFLPPIAHAAGLGFAVLIAASAVASRSATAAGTEAPRRLYTTALGEAKANLATPEGHAYDLVLAPFLREQNAAVLGACFKTVQVPDKTAFEAVLRLAKSGRVLNAAVWPETNIGKCLMDGLKTKTFPAPPRESYWTNLRMSLGP
jgi:hypothetical protein